MGLPKTEVSIKEGARRHTRRTRAGWTTQLHRHKLPVDQRSGLKSELGYSTQKINDGTILLLPVSLKDDKKTLSHYFKVNPAFPELIEARIRQCLGDYEKQLPLQVNS